MTVPISQVRGQKLKEEVPHVARLEQGFKPRLSGSKHNTLHPAAADQVWLLSAGSSLLPLLISELSAGVLMCHRP